MVFLAYNGKACLGAPEVCHCELDLNWPCVTPAALQTCFLPGISPGLRSFCLGGFAGQRVDLDSWDLLASGYNLEAHPVLRP